MKKTVWALIVLGVFLTTVVHAADQEKKYETAEAVIGADGIQRLEIQAGSYYYKPNYIVVKAGMPVEFTLKKEPGITPHDIVLTMEGTDIKIKRDITTKGTVIQFTPTKPGKFPFSCDKKLLFFPSHKDKGMEGIIEVRE